MAKHQLPPGIKKGSKRIAIEIKVSPDRSDWWVEPDVMWPVPAGGGGSNRQTKMLTGAAVSVAIAIAVGVGFVGYNSLKDKDVLNMTMEERRELLNDLAPEIKAEAEKAATDAAIKAAVGKAAPPTTDTDTGIPDPQLADAMSKASEQITTGAGAGSSLALDNKPATAQATRQAAEPTEVSKSKPAASPRHGGLTLGYNVADNRTQLPQNFPADQSGVLRVSEYDSTTDRINANVMMQQFLENTADFFSVELEDNDASPAGINE